MYHSEAVFDPDLGRRRRYILLNTKFNKTLQELGDVQISVITNEGEKLIGNAVDGKVLGAVNPQIAMFSDQEGIWLKREQKLSFLGDDNIKLVQKAKPFEKEIDNAL